ncbi:hypothetical protein [Rhodoligotrophos defluvii]|uniref:hypothetical protein n=1 Tax=Rhodoligotrophos defluvii TaxID=2561934 RepID=UPI001EEFB8BD|nr:hypothetical protein [Rhodoligotrophos defluvii]
MGAPDAICEMCELQEIRYVHHMQHADYPAVLEVGCVCAEHMEDDYQGPRRRERNLKNAARRRSRWLNRYWKLSRQGNPYINTDGFNITVFRRQDGAWGGRIEDRSSGQSITSRRRYGTEDQAKLAAFDAMIFLKDKRGWGRSE